LLSFCSATICQKIKADGGLELLINTVKDPNTPVKQLEKVLGSNMTCFTFHCYIIMVRVLTLQFPCRWFMYFLKCLTWGLAWWLRWVRLLCTSAVFMVLIETLQPNTLNLLAGELCSWGCNQCWEEYSRWYSYWKQCHFPYICKPRDGQVHHSLMAMLLTFFFHFISS